MRSWANPFPCWDSFPPYGNEMGVERGQVGWHQCFLHFTQSPGFTYGGVTRKTLFGRDPWQKNKNKPKIKTESQGTKSLWENEYGPGMCCPAWWLWLLLLYESCWESRSFFFLRVGLKCSCNYVWWWILTSLKTWWSFHSRYKYQNHAIYSKLI